MSEQGPASQPLRVGRKVSHTPGPDKNKYLNRMWGERKND